MKKTYLLLIALITFIGSLTAQTNYIDGVWKLTEMHHAGEVLPVKMHLIFNKAGEIEMSGQNVGTWSQNETENTFTIDCPYLGEIEGENKILVLNNVELKISNANGDVNSFHKISLPKNKELHNKITGYWFFEKMERKGETNVVGAMVQFNKNGIFHIGDRVSGTWNYNEPSDKIIFNTSGFEGEYTFTQPNKNELVITIDEDKSFFLKIDKQKIINENKMSGLFGAWEFKGEPDSHTNTYLTFNEPDEFKMVVKQGGMKSISTGTWIFDKQKTSLTIIGGGDMLKGNNKIAKIDDESIELENNGKIFKANKKSVNKIEHLTFTNKDFHDETGDYLYYDDENKLPWNDDPLEMMMTLVNVKHLVYKHSSLIEEVNVFESETLTANVNSNPQEQELSIDYIFNGYDSYNLPDNTGLPPNEFNKIYGYTYNKLYPEEDNTFRVVGEEEITTPAGTFNCTVVEAIGGSDNKLKLWMINDKPWVFAKIIKERTDDMFGYYHMYELQEIKQL